MYDNVKEAMGVLMDYANPENDIKSIQGDKLAPITAHDLQQLIYEVGANVCDLLGMSDLYTGGDSNETSDNAGNDEATGH